MSSSKSAVPHVFITHLHPNKLASMTVRGSTPNRHLSSMGETRMKDIKVVNCANLRTVAVTEGGLSTPSSCWSSGRATKSPLDKSPWKYLSASETWYCFQICFIHFHHIHTCTGAQVVGTYNFSSFFLIFKSISITWQIYKYYSIMKNNHIRFIFFPHGPWASLITFQAEELLESRDSPWLSRTNYIIWLATQNEGNPQSRINHDFNFVTSWYDEAEILHRKAFTKEWTPATKTFRRKGRQFLWMALCQKKALGRRKLSITAKMHHLPILTFVDRPYRIRNWANWDPFSS